MKIRPYRQISLFFTRYMRATGDTFKNASRDSASTAKLHMEEYAEKLASGVKSNFVQQKIVDLPEIVESVSVRSPIIMFLHNTRVRIRYAADFEDDGDPLSSLTDLHIELKSCSGKRCVEKCQQQISRDEISSRQSLQTTTLFLLTRDLSKDVFRSILFAIATTPPSPPPAAP